MSSELLSEAFAPQRRLRALLVGIALVVAVTVVVSALATPPLYSGIDALARFPFQRVLRRVAMVVAFALLTLGLVRLGIRRPAQLGLAFGRSRLQTAVATFAAGLAAVAVLFAIEIALGLRVIGHHLTLGRVAAALGAAVVIGIVEEGFFRGGLLFPFGRLTGRSFWIANAVVSALYATVHFARGGGAAGAIDWMSGFRVWALVPQTALDRGEAWLGLFATGVLFYVLAARQGHAWGAVGLHAGAVLGLQSLGTWSGPVVGRDSIFFADGLLPGYGTTLLAVAAAGWLMRRQPAHRSD